MPPRAPDSVDLVVARNVRIRRIAKGLSQTQLGRRIGVTFQQLQKYETGVNRISCGGLVRIAEVLEVPAATLFEGVDGGANSRTASLLHLHLLADPRSFRLAQAFRAIQDADLCRSLVVLVERVAAAVRRGRRRGK
jgi:transcriptional regulator with XRE-family HTH domain